jgi:hypothetical protein
VEPLALHWNITPARNDGKTIYRLSVKDPPVDRFWPISVSTIAAASLPIRRTPIR